MPFYSKIILNINITLYFMVSLNFGTLKLIMTWLLIFILPDCCKQDMVLKRASKSCHCAYPIKLDLFLSNVSQNPSWNDFLNELAVQLGLRNTQIELINFYVLGVSTLNISMNITPHKGISFSASEVSKINSSLSMHKVKLDPRLVGGYQLLNITWFEPPAPSQGN